MNVCYILILTAVYAGYRMQFEAEVTQDQHFDSVSEALEFATDTISGFEPDSVPDHIRAVVMNTKDNVVHVYDIQEQPRKFYWTAH